MKSILQILNLAFGVMLPFLFVGSAFFVIPKFLMIYQEMFAGGLALPWLTQMIVDVPRFIWLLVACVLAVLNVISVSKSSNGGLLCFSVLIMFLLSGAVVVALFLPVVSGGIIKQLPPSDPVPVAQ